MAWRSTTLKLVEERCPAALDFYEARAPRDLSVFQPGIAAHAVLQVVGDAVREGKAADPGAIGDAVVRELVTVGRAFEGDAEPPMSVQHATEGRDIALRYLEFHELSPTARYELGLAVNRRWEPVAYNAPDVYYRAALDVLDVVETEDDDGYPSTLAVVTDWKSAWPTSAAELATIQLRGQGAIVAAHHPEAAVLRRRAANLRTGIAYEDELVLDDDGQGVVRRWRSDIDHAIAAAEARGPDGRRQARPGAGCLGCPYLTRCEAGRGQLRGSLAEGDREMVARRFALADAIRAELFEVCKTLAAEAPIRLPDGGEVGFREAEEREAADEAARHLAHAWFGVPESDASTWDAQNARLLGLLAAIGLGVGAIERAARAIHPRRKGAPTWKADREALLSRTLTTRTTAKFGIHPRPESS